MRHGNKKEVKEGEEEEDVLASCILRNSFA